jgi:hypothetical protein
MLNENIAGGGNGTGSGGVTDTPTASPPTTSLPISSKSNQPLTRAHKLTEITKDKGALTWNQGALFGKRRWDVILYPYDQPSDHIILFQNNPPKGAKVVSNAGSAFTTAKLLYGRIPSKTLFINDVGFDQLQVNPQGKSVMSLRHAPITKRPTAVNGHKDLPTQSKDSIDGSKPVFPLR